MVQDVNFYKSQEIFPIQYNNVPRYCDTILLYTRFTLMSSARYPFTKSAGKDNRDEEPSVLYLEGGNQESCCTRASTRFSQQISGYRWR